MSVRRRCRTAAAASLETLGIWDAVAAQATAIRKIHVSDQGRFGMARLDAAEQNLQAMGYVLPNRALGSALWSRVLGAGAAVRIFCPARVTGEVTTGAAAATLAVEVHGVETVIEAR